MWEKEKTSGDKWASPPRTLGPPRPPAPRSLGSDGPATGRKDEPYAALTMRGRTVHINVLSIAIKGIFILKHDFFPFQFCLTAGFNNASDGPSIKYYDNCSGAFINYVISRGRMGVKSCQFYLAKRQLRWGGGQKSSLLRGDIVYWRSLPYV